MGLNEHYMESLIKNGLSPVTTMTEYAIYRGTKVVVISKNYQNGSASVADLLADGNQGPSYWVDISDLKNLTDNESWLAWDFGTPAEKKCTCGSDKVPGLAGHHSNWCDKFNKWENS